MSVIKFIRELFDELENNIVVPSLWKFIKTIGSVLLTTVFFLSFFFCISFLSIRFITWFVV